MKSETQPSAGAEQSGDVHPDVDGVAALPDSFHHAEGAAGGDAGMWMSEHAAAYEAAAQAVHHAQTETSGSGDMHTGYDHFNDTTNETDMLKRTTKKKSKGGRIASEITREELSECFNMASEEAAKKLGVGLTVLKRICRKFGVPRWPYRKLKSLDRLITNVESGTPPGDTYKHLMKSAEEIREHQKAMCTGQVMELDEKTKKLQQAYSKFNHKLRKAQKDDDGIVRERGHSGARSGDMAMSGDGKRCKTRSSGGCDDELDQAVTAAMSSAPAAPAMGEHVQQEAMMYMPLPAMPFPMPMMMVDPASYQQQMMAGMAAQQHQQQQHQQHQQQQQQQQQPTGQPHDHATVAGVPAAMPDAVQQPMHQPQDRPEGAAEVEQRPPAEDPTAAGSTDAAAVAASQMAAWGHYAMPQAAAEAAAAYWKGWAAPQAGSTDGTAAAAAGYYAHPMASYMAAAAAGQPGYAYPYMPGYMAGYDPSAMQQYYQQAQAHAMAAAGAAPAAMGEAGAETGAATASAVYQMPGADGTAAAMDPNQAAAAAAAAHAAYYSQWPWAVQGTIDMSQMQAMPVMAQVAQPADPAASAAPSVAAPMSAPAATGKHAAASAAQSAPASHAPDPPREEEGKRKRRPNVKYEGDFTHGDELDGLINEATKPLPSKVEESDTRGAQALVQMAAAPASSEQVAVAQAPQMPAATATSLMMAPQAMMQMPGGAMAMAHPGMMMHAAAAAWSAYPAAMMPMDMTGKPADASAYYPMMMPGYTYTAAS